MPTTNSTLEVQPDFSTKSIKPLMIGFVTLQTERRNQMGWLANINNVKFSKAVVRITGNPINMGSGIFH